MIKMWTDAAWEDFQYWTTQDRKNLRRILQLLKDIDRNGYEGIGKPERLSGDLSAYYSRRSTAISLKLSSAARIIGISKNVQVLTFALFWV